MAIPALSRPLEGTEWPLEFPCFPCLWSNLVFHLACSGRWVGMKEGLGVGAFKGRGTSLYPPAGSRHYPPSTAPQRVRVLDTKHSLSLELKVSSPSTKLSPPWAKVGRAQGLTNESFEMEIKFFLFLKMVGMTLFFEVACFGQEVRKKRKRRRR